MAKRVRFVFDGCKIFLCLKLKQLEAICRPKNSFGEVEGSNWAVWLVRMVGTTW